MTREVEREGEKKKEKKWKEFRIGVKGGEQRGE